MATIRNLIVRISVTERTDNGIRRVTTSLRETNRELDAADKRSSRFTSTLSKLGHTSVSGLTKGLTRLVSISAKVAVGLAAVGAAVASLNTLVQAGASLAPLAGLLALLPGAALGAAAAIGTLKLAFSGFSDAFAAIKTGDQEKFDKALEKMGPAARSVAKELFALRPAFLSIRDATQNAVFGPLQGQLTAVTRVLVGPLRQGVAQVGHEFALAGLSVAQFVRQSQTVGVLQGSFAAVAASIHQMLPALQPVLAGFRDLAGVGLTFMPGLAASTGTVAARFGAWMQQMAASGKAAQWIQNALATLRQLGTVLANVGGILKSVFSAASAAGSNFLGVIGQALGQLNAFLKTAQGQAALQSIFQGLAAIGATLGPVIAALVTQLGTLAAPIGRLITLVGPILTTAINALGPALAALEPGIAAILGGLGQAVTILAPALAPLARAFSQIAVAIAPVLPMVARLVAQLVSALAPILGQLFVALGPLIGAIVKLAGVFAPLIPPIAAIIVQLVQGLVPALIPIIGLIGRIAGIIGQFLIDAFQQLAPVIVQIMPTLSDLAQNVGVALVTVLVALAPALIDILKALLPLVPSFVQLLIPTSRLLVILAPIIALVIRFAAVILRNVLPIVVWLIRVIVKLVTAIENGLVGAVGWLVRNLGKIGGWVVGALKGAGKWLYNIGKDIVVGLWNGIASLGSWLWKRVWSWVKSVLPGPVKFALGIHSPSKVMAELGGFAGQGLAQGILGTAGTVARAAGTLAQAAVPAIPGAGLTTAPAAAPAMAAAPRGVASAAGSAGGTVVLQVQSSGRAVDDFLAEMIRRYVRVVGGGNVQVAFGRGA